MQNSYIILVRKYLGRSPLGRPRTRWDVNVMMVVRAVVCEYRDGCYGGSL